MTEVTQAVLHDLLLYDPKTGHFLWRERLGTHHGAIVFNMRYAGKRAGRVCRDGYRGIVLFGAKRYSAHRLAWLYMTGTWPQLPMDHRNLDKDDNSWTNLRLATPSQNVHNQRAKSNNRSGLKGVGIQGKKFVASIARNGVRIELGRFTNAEEAHAAYARKAAELDGEFARAS